MYLSYVHPAGIEPEESGILLVGFTTLDAEAEGPPLVGPAEGRAIVVTTEDATSMLIAGVVEATQTVGIDGIDVSDTL